MTETQPNGFWMWWAVCGLVAAGLVAGGGYYLAQGHGRPEAHGAEGAAAPGQTGALPVVGVQPQKGGMDRTTVQPGTVLAYESVKLFAEVSGYLKTQDVDIGSKVKRGQTLAVIDVPDLQKNVQRNKAAHEQALARIDQMKAQVKVASAEWEASKAAVVQSEAAFKSSEAWARFREKQLQRMRDLFAEKAIEERLYEEAKERYEAAVETVRAANAAITTSKAQVTAMAAKIEKAQADVSAGDAEARVTKSEWEKSEVLVQFANIPSPFDGIITQRSQFPGDFVRAAAGGGQVPLLTVERTDRMRVIVQIPDRDVPYADPGDTAFVELDALPGKKLEATISRIAGSEDPETRLMRVEIDLPNPTGKIRQGMYGRVTIILEKSADVLSVPSAALVGKTRDGKGKVFVVRSNVARLMPVEIGDDDGVRVTVLRGLRADDWVVAHPGAGLRDGSTVTVTPAAPDAKTDDDE